MTENEIGKIVIDTAIAVHRELGPGLLESVYRVVLGYELLQRGLSIEQEVAIPIIYKGKQFDQGFRADLIVEKKVIIELKSIDKTSPAHKKQVQTYLKLANCKLGYLLNFGEELMKSGITRCVNHLDD